VPLADQPVEAKSNDRSASLKWIRHFFANRLTASGRLLFVVGTVVTALTVVSPIAAKIHFVFCFLAAIALISMPAARLARVPLKVRLEIAPKATCGATLKAILQLSNESKRDAVDLGFALHGLPEQLVANSVMVPVLGAGENATISFEIELKRRGYYLLSGVRQETWFPFGVWRDLLVYKMPQTLLVYPRFSPLIDLDIPVGLRYQPGGVALSSNVGDSTEFLGVRQFKPGDSIRNIHWKSWGRVGEPVVKEFQEEFFCKIALVLDTFLPPGSGEEYRADFEAILSVAAAIADHLSQTEYIVDLFAAGPDLYTLEAGRNLAHLDNVLDVLACLEPSYQTPFETVAPALTEHLGTITTVIFVMLDWDQDRERMARVVREYGPAVKTILVRQSAPSLDPAGADQAIVVLTPEQVEQGVEQL
jgi:uncharacterized protein (DUF58 family)